MTRINIIKFNDGYRIEVLGHSGYAEKGKDIVCASISTLVQYMEMVIDKICEHELEKFEEGTFILNIRKLAIGGSDTLYDYDFWYMFIITLVGNFEKFIEELQEQYPENVKLKVIEEDKCLIK